MKNSPHPHTCTSRCAAGLAVVAVLTFWVSESAGGGDEPVPVHRQPFHITVARDSTPQTASATKTIAIHEKIQEVFKDSPIVWDPTERLSGVALVCDVTGDRLSVGTNKQSPVYIEWTRHKLRKDEPGKLTVRVTDPRSLKPGVYRGTLSAMFRSDGEAINRSLKVAWDVILEVRGRRLVSAEFQRKKAGKPLRVGAPASLLVTVNTVGCDLGRGRVKLDWGSTAQTPRRALYLDLPLERPIDPLVHFPSKSEQGVHPQWRDCPVWTEVRPLERKTPAVKPGLDNLHEILVVAPDCFLPGSLQAEVEWQQADFAANQEPLKTATGPEPVLPGILVFPSPAFVNEPVSVLVRTERDHGAVVPLVVSGPNGQSILQLERRREALPGSSDRLQEYVTRFFPEVMGSYHVTCGDNADLQQDLGDPVALEACLGAYSALVGELEVFASAPPFWRTDSSGWKVILPEAFRFWYDGRLLRQAEMEDLGTFRGVVSEKLVPSDPETDPNLQFWPHDPAAWRGGEPRAADGAEQSQSKGPPPAQTAAPPTENNRWPLAPDWEQSLALDMMVDLVRDAQDDPRHRTGRYEFVQRMLLHARDTRGNQVYRVVHIPITLEVSTDWQYYRWILGGLGTIVGLGAIWWYVSRRSVGPPKPPPTGRLDELPDESQSPDDYFSARAIRRPAPDPNGQPAPPERQPPPPALREPAGEPEPDEEPVPQAESSQEDDWWSSDQGS